MADLEKQAWFQLGIVVLTLAAFFVLISFARLDSVSLSVFAIAGFLGFRPGKRRRGGINYDERDRQIERNALLSSLCIFYMAVILFSVVAQFTNGWDASIPVLTIIQIFWTMSLAVWGVKALIIILSYRRSAHA